MSEKKEYRNSVRSRRLIRQTFLELLEEREFGKITVTDIVARADLNRSTFYAHYPDIYGVVEEIQNEIVRQNMELFTKIEYRNILKDPMPYLRSIVAALEENLALFQKMGHTGSLDRQLDICKRMMVDDIMNHSDIPAEVRSSPAFPVRIHFFLGGITNTFQQWAQGNLTCTSEEICRDIARIIQQTASAFLENDWMQQV